MSIPDRELVLPHLVHRAAWRGGTPSRDHHRGDRPTPRMCSRPSTPTSSTLPARRRSERGRPHSVRRATHRARPRRGGDYRL